MTTPTQLVRSSGTMSLTSGGASSPEMKRRSSACPQPTAETLSERIKMTSTTLHPTPVRLPLKPEPVPAPFALSPEFTTRYRYTKDPVVIESTEDGVAWAMGRRMIAVPHRDELIVELRAGATVAHLLDVGLDIRHLREGTSALRWREWPLTKPGRSVFTAIVGVMVDDARKHDLIVPCTVLGCDERGRHHEVDHHPEDGPVHRQHIASSQHFTITLFLDPLAADAPRWEVVSDTAEEITPAEAARFAHELKWATAEAAKLNASLTPALAGVAS